MAGLNNWAYIRASGRVENVQGENLDFEKVIAKLYEELSCAGGNHDRPMMVLHNGRSVPFPEGKDPFNFAFSYMQIRQELIYAAKADAWDRVKTPELEEFLNGK